MFANNWDRYEGYEHLEAVFDVKVIYCSNSLRNITYRPETK